MKTLRLNKESQDALAKLLSGQCTSEVLADLYTEIQQPEEDGPVEKKLREHLKEAEDKAWDSLARYKFQMFGYWAAIWVHVNRIGGFNESNPFSITVKLAREKLCPTASK